MSDGKYTSIKLPPGIFRNQTEYAAEGKYYACDKVRFRGGNPQTIGGWLEFSMTATIDGVPRAIRAWTSLGFRKYIAIGTSTYLYAFEAGTLADISPIRFSSTASQTFATVSGSQTVTATVSTHGSIPTSRFFLTSDLTVGGITLVANQIYTVKAVTDTSVFTFDVPTAATSTASTTATRTVNFILNPGIASNSAISGYGTNTWSSGTFGTPRSSSIGVKLRQWSFDNWGEDLLACLRGGPIYYWTQDQGLGSRAVNISTAPQTNNCILVEDASRILVAYGSTTYGTNTYDPLLIRWSNSEDYTDWDPTVSGTSAGDFRLNSGTEIIGVCKSRNETLIFTDNATYVQRLSSDANNVFEFSLLGQNAGLVSQNAVVDVNSTVYWWGPDSLFVYNGRLEKLPSELYDYLFDTQKETSFNQSQKEKIFCGVNSEFNEVWWFYPTRDSDENNAYVVYNWVENCWYYGSLSRTTWSSATTFEYPLATTPDGKIFMHENGLTDNGAGISSFIETAFIDIDEGDDSMLLDKIIPDFEILTGPVEIEVTSKRYPHDTFPVVKGPFMVLPDTQFIPFRSRGRQMKIKYSSSAVGCRWELGNTRVRIIADGQR